MDSPLSGKLLFQCPAGDEREARSAEALLTEQSLMDMRGRTVAWVIRDIARLFAQAGQQAIASLEVNMSHWYYLRVLEAGPMTQLELARGVGMASNTAVTTIDFLERNGLVVRTKDQADRRKNYVSLTDQGRCLIHGVMDLFAHVLHDAFRGFKPTERAQLLKLLLVLETNLASASEGADGTVR